MYCRSPVKYEISSSALGRPDDPSRVLHWPSVSVTSVGWELSPSPRYSQWSSTVFKLAFWCLTLSTRNAVTWTCDWLNWFSLIIIIIDFNFSHQQRLPGVRVSSSFLLLVFFSGGLPFALVRLGLELLSSSLFLSRYSVRVALLFSPLASCLASSTAVSLEW
jgi:hypothetical protein